MPLMRAACEKVFDRFTWVRGSPMVGWVTHGRVYKTFILILQWINTVRANISKFWWVFHLTAGSLPQSGGRKLWHSTVRHAYNNFGRHLT